MAEQLQELVVEADACAGLIRQFSIDEDFRRGGFFVVSGADHEIEVDKS
jgi:hypothetical protein